MTSVGPIGRLAVLVDDPAAAWQAETVRALEDRGLPVEVVPYARPARPRRAGVALYARLDRWPAAVHVPRHARGDADPHTVVDLTSTRSSGPRAGSGPVLVVEPRGLDAESMLPLLSAGRRTLELEVRRLKPDGVGEVVARSTVALNRFSARRSAERAGRRAKALVMRAVDGLGSGLGADADGAEEREQATASTGAVARLLLNGAVAGIKLRTTRVDWRVAYGPADPSDPFSLPTTLRPVPAPAGRFYADPFLAATEGGTYLFVEDFDLTAGRASISAIDLESGAATGAFSADHHLSYPFVLQHEGTWYMTPEAAESRQVVLLRCDRFPDRWDRDAVLLDGVAAYDPTLLRHEGLWWLFFASGSEGAAIDDELHVWFSPSLRGPFEPHPANPVRSTVRGARPAGRILEVDGRLVRPGQDGSREYGGGIVLFEIERLTPTEYHERPLQTLSSSALGADGLHTIDSGGGIVVVDTKHRVLRLPRRGGG